MRVVEMKAFLARAQAERRLDAGKMQATNGELRELLS
jgi:hypothetical protein